MSEHSLTDTSPSDNVWFVNSGVSTHMTSHEHLFRELRKPDQHRYVETRDDTTRPVRHVENVPFGNDGKQTYLKNVLHVPTITKNLLSFDQIVEHGMQVQFKNEGCFVEKDGRLVAHSRREGRMFVLKSNEVKSAMFVKGLKLQTDLKRGTKESATSIVRSSKTCNQKEWS